MSQFNQFAVYITLLLFFYVNANASNTPSDTTTSTNPTTDSLILQLENCNLQPQTCHDTIKIQLLRKIGDAYNHLQESLPYYQQALELSISNISDPLNTRKNISAACYNDIGLVQKNLGNYDKALGYFLKALRLFEEISMTHTDDTINKEGIANSLNNIGNIYRLQGNYNLALDNYQKSLRIDEELKDKKGIAHSFNNIGIVYGLQANYDLALSNYLKSLRIKEELNDKKGIANSLNNIGGVYYFQNKKDSAIIYLIRSLKITKEIGDKAGVVLSLDNIGQFYDEQASTASPAKRKQLYEKAIAYSDSSLTIAREIGDKYMIMTSGNSLANIYSKIDNFQKAYEYHLIYSNYKDSIFNEEKSKEIGKLEATHEFLLKKAEEEAKVKALKEIEEEKKFRQNVIEYFVVVIVIVLLLVGIMVWQKKMPPVVLRFIVFFTTILFFEFLLVLIAPFIITYTSGAPLWLMLINSAIASILFIPQNFIQNRFGAKLLPTPASGSIDNNIVKLLLVIGLCVLNIPPLLVSSQQIPNPKSQILNSSIDSLKQALLTTKEGTTKIQLLRKIGDAYNDLQESLPYYQQALGLSISNTSAPAKTRKNFEAICYNDIAEIQLNFGNYEIAFNNYFQSLVIFEELLKEYPDDVGIKKNIASNLNNTGVIYQYQGNYDLALDYLLKSLRIYEELMLLFPDEFENNKGIANNMNNIGNIYRYQSDYNEALNYYMKSLSIKKSIGMINSKEYAGNLNNIANIYDLQNNYKQALENHKMSLRISENIKDKKGIAISLNNIGINYYYQNQKDSVLVYFIRSMEIDEEIGNKAGVAIGLANIGEIYAEQASEANNKKREQLYKKAITFSDSSLNIAKKIGDKLRIIETGKNLSNIYSKLKTYKKAYEYHQLYSTYKDSIFNEEKSKEIGKLQTKHDLEMKELGRKIAEEEISRQEAVAIGRRDKLQYSVIVLGVFALIGIALLVSRFTIAAWAIEFLSFVPFLLLFETLLVLIDPYLERYAGGSPLYTVIANTVFAIGLFPLHQFMEKKLKWMFYRKKRMKVEEK